MIEEHLITTTPVTETIRKFVAYREGKITTRTQSVQSIVMEEPSLWQRIQWGAPVGAVLIVAYAIFAK